MFLWLPSGQVGPEFSATHTPQSAEWRKVAAAAARLAVKWGKLSQQLVNVPFGDFILHFKMIVGCDFPHGLKSTLVVYFWGRIPSDFMRQNCFSWIRHWSSVVDSSWNPSRHLWLSNRTKLCIGLLPFAAQIHGGETLIDFPIFYFWGDEHSPTIWMFSMVYPCFTSIPVS